MVVSNNTIAGEANITGLRRPPAGGVSCGIRTCRAGTFCGIFLWGCCVVCRLSDPGPPCVLDCLARLLSFVSVTYTICRSVGGKHAEWLVQERTGSGGMVSGRQEMWEGILRNTSVGEDETRMKLMDKQGMPRNSIYITVGASIVS